MRRQVRPRHQGRGRRHWPSRALCCRLVPQQRTYQAHRPRAQWPQGRCHRRRSVRPDRRGRSGQAGLQGHRLRSPARCGRRVDVRHPRVPSAQGHRPARGRGPEGAGRGHRDEHGHWQGADHRRADERLRLRGRLRCFRCRSAPLYGHPRREPERRLLRQRVPDPRQPDEGVQGGFPHAHHEEQVRCRCRRRQCRHGRCPLREASGCRECLHRLPPRHGRAACP